MNRREFITLLGGGAAAWPVAARAQQPAMPVVAWLDPRVRAAQSPALMAAFRQGLNELGFVEGRNVAIEFSYADNQLDRLPMLAADLVRRRVAVIVSTNVTTPAAKAATSTIPIVFYSGSDPVEAGYVNSLTRPGGNVTGVSVIASTLNPRRLELLHELVPKPAVIALLWDPTPDVRNVEAQLRDMEAAARALGRQILIVKAGNESAIDAAFATVIQAGAGALFVGTGPFYNSQRQKLVALAARHALPASYHLRDFVEAGGLMSYSANEADANRRLGVYVGRILKGEKPSDLPVELPTKYELVLNLKTAKALGLTMPPSVLARADEVIE
jgi:putative ABC transport system substrate-binding protein